MTGAAVLLAGICYMGVCCAGVAHASYDAGAKAYADGDFSTAFAAWMPDAKAEAPAAQANIATMYRLGLGVNVDHERAVAWYERAARQGYAAARYELGMMALLGEGRPASVLRAAEWFKQAALQGDAKAQFRLGALYEAGQGAPADKSLASRWYAAAAKKGLADAQFGLGKLYMTGDGVNRDEAAARAWFGKAARQGHATAQISLAVMLHVGVGAPVDLATAAGWYSAAADQGNAVAKRMFRVLAERGVIPKAPDLLRSSPASAAVRKRPTTGGLAAVQDAFGVAKSLGRSSGYVLRLASYRSKRAALAGRKTLQKRYPDELRGFDIRLARADLGSKGVFYRIEAAGAETADAARTVCETITGKGDPCMVLRVK